MTELQDGGASTAEHKARRLFPKGAEDRPERVWAEFHQLLPELIELLKFDQPEELVGNVEELSVEATREEIMTLLEPSPPEPE